MKHYEHPIERKSLVMKALIDEHGAVASSVYYNLIDFFANEAEDDFFVIFADEEFYRSLAASLRIKPCRLKSILLTIAELDIIDRDMHNVNILFSKKFFDKNANYLAKFLKDKEKKFTIFPNKLKLFLNSKLFRNGRPDFTMIYEKFLQHFSTLYINIHSTSNNNRNINNVSSYVDNSEPTETFFSPTATVEKTFFEDLKKPEVRKNETISESPPSFAPKQATAQCGGASPPREQSHLSTFEPNHATAQCGGASPPREQSHLSTFDVSSTAITEKNPATIKKRKILFTKNHEKYRLAVHFFELIKARDPTLSTANVDLHEWAAVLQFARELKGRSFDEIKQAMDYSQESEFWQSKIFKPESFCRNYMILKQQSIHRPEERKGRYTHDEMQYVISKNMYTHNDFVRCVDGNGEEIYWNKTKGKCPYKEYVQDIILLLKKYGEDKFGSWNFTKNNYKLPQGYYAVQISLGNEEYKKSGFNLEFYADDEQFKILNQNNEMTG